jgi:hypothetical protein
MQRVRIGITGLSVVFLIVLLAAAVVGFRQKDVGGEMGNLAGGNNEAAFEQPKDPLAELGVAPGNPQADSPTRTPATHP